MAAGCTNTKAVNYNPAATEDDGSCIYLVKEAGICYAFDEEVTTRDESYTASYSFDGKNWRHSDQTPAWLASRYVLLPSGDVGPWGACVQ